MVLPLCKTGIIDLVRRVRWVYKRQPILFKLKEKKVRHLFCKFEL